MNATPAAPAKPRDLSALVTAVFERWRRENIPFLILRNYEGLPNDTTNDIDVLVPPAQLNAAERALVAAARQSGFVLHNRAEFSPVSLFFHHPESQEQIQFDLFHHLNWRGFALLPEAEVLARGVDRGLFAVPQATDESVLNLVTRLLYQNELRERYKPGILAGLRAGAANATAALARLFGAHVAHQLTEAVLAERWQVAQRLAGAMRRRLMWRRLTRQPFVTASAVLRDLGRFAGRLRRLPGLTVVLLGADGSGKSAVVTQLHVALQHTFSPAKSFQGHWKPVVFPRRHGPSGSVTDPHGRPPRGKLASRIMLTCHWLEFLAGWCVQFLPVLFRNGLVLMDRYHYDFIVDPRRYRLQVSPTFVRALFRLMPSPNLVILLDAPIEVLRSRKQEVPPEETRRQQEAFRALAAGLPQARIVDGSQSLDIVVRDTAGHVLKCLAERQVKRSNS
jgi:thymidylate kinase